MMQFKRMMFDAFMDMVDNGSIKFNKRAWMLNGVPVVPFVTYGEVEKMIDNGSIQKKDGGMLVSMLSQGEIVVEVMPALRIDSIDHLVEEGFIALKPKKTAGEEPQYFFAGTTKPVQFATICTAACSVVPVEACIS